MSPPSPRPNEHAAGAARRRRVALLVAAALVPGAAGSAQVLELGGADAPPRLARPTYAEDVVGRLEEEIADRIAREPEASSFDRIVLRASVNVRVIAADLISVGDEAQGRGSVAILAGLTLASGRSAVDELLESLADPSADASAEARVATAREALRQFNEEAVRRAESLRTADVGRLDRVLPAVLASLADAVAALDGGAAVSHWPSASAVRAASGAAPYGGSLAGDDSIEALRDGIDRSPLPEPTRALLAEIVDFLERAEPFADLRAVAAGYRPIVADAIDLGVAIDAAGWLAPDAAEAFRERLHRALVLFRDPSTRARGMRRLELLSQARRAIEPITVLATDRRAEVGPVAEAFLAVDGLAARAAETDAAQPRLETLELVVDRMIQHRRLEPLESGPRLQVVYRELDRRCRGAESALLDQLRAIAGGTDVLADPAFASLLNDHRQHLEDLRRLQRVPGWIDRASLIHPPSGRRFGTTTRAWCERLLDPTRRPDAILEMSSFERQLDAFYPLPFERDLQAGTGPAVQATGGFHEPFVAELERRRRTWIESWSGGEVAPEIEVSMERVHRLARLMSDTATVFRLGGDATALNAWAAWELPAGALARALSELPSRLKLAVAAVIERDDEALVLQLEQIGRSAPQAQLLGRLAQHLETTLAELPAGAASAIGQLLYPPTSGAWLVGRRATLADLCRYGLEETHARTTGNLELADDLAAYVNAGCARVLQDLDDAP